MPNCQITHPDALDADLAARWRAIAASRPETSSPLLGPDFARAVGRVRPDAAVAVWRVQDEPVAFLPHLRRPGGLARPMGAPLADYHGLIADRRVDVAEALRKADIGAYRFTGLIDPHGAFADQTHAKQQAFVIDIADPLAGSRVSEPVVFTVPVELPAPLYWATLADGTPIDMANEKARLEDEVKRLDRKILALQPPAGRA